MFALFASILIVSISGVFTSQPNVVVLSFDGFKPEYYSKETTPKLFALQDKAAGPKFLKTIFPSKTFVTHYSVSTGVYPGVHGVYGNKMFDSNGQEIFNTKEQFQTNDKIVPIWIENQKKGEGRHSGVMMWPGSEYPFDGIEPTYVQKYDTAMTWDKRVAKIVEWMSSTDKRANLVMAYFEDTSSHDVSLKSSELTDHIKKVDDTIQEIYDSLVKANIDGNLDLIIMSDHGTKQVKYDDILVIENYTTINTNEIIVSGPIAFIKSKDKNELEERLKQLCGHQDFLKSYFVYTQNDFKKHWNMKELASLNLIIILVAAPGKTFYKRDQLTNAVGNLDKNKFVVEVNGYDNDETSMNAFFVGIGPTFRDNYFPNEHFDLIDVYPILKLLLKLRDPINNIQNNVNPPDTVLKYLEKDKL